MKELFKNVFQFFCGCVLLFTITFGLYSATRSIIYPESERYNKHEQLGLELARKDFRENRNSYVFLNGIDAELAYVKEYNRLSEAKHSEEK
jgi:hypothetical protein